MSRLLQALALALLATLTTATSAAALSAQNRIKAPSESTHSRVGSQALLTPQTHRGIDAATTTIASEMSLAPGGRPKVGPGLGPPKVASNDILATPNRLQNKLAAWRRYQGNGGTKSLREWSKRYDTLQANRLRGKWRESFGEAGEVFDTPYGRRIVDNAPSIEVKTGYATRSRFIRRQTLKDVWLGRNVEGYQPFWRFCGRVSDPLRRHLETFDIPYEVVK